MKVLVVVDMQYDFVTGTLGTPEAQKIVPKVVEEIQKRASEDTAVLFTKDTHYDDYLDTLEGKNLPIPHCIKESDGWQICDELYPFVNTVIDKVTFGSMELPQYIKNLGESIEEITLCG